MEGPVSQGPAQRFPLGQQSAGVGVESPIAKTFPHIVDGLLRGMKHIGIIETIVAQLIRYDFIGGKVMATLKSAAQLVDGQQQDGLAQLAAVESVFGITIGANSEHDVQKFVLREEAVEQSAPRVHHVGHRERGLGEEDSRHFVAVGHDAPIVRPPVNAVRPERHVEAVEPRQCVAGRYETAVYLLPAGRGCGCGETAGMQPAVPESAAVLHQAVRGPSVEQGGKGQADAFRIVKHAEGIDVDPEAGVGHVSAHMFGKTRPQQQRPVAVVEPDTRFGQVHWSTKAHHKVAPSLSCRNIGPKGFPAAVKADTRILV